MALTSKSLFLYGFQVTEYNRSLDFDAGDAELKATLRLGFYSLTSLLTEISRAMQAVDPAHRYTATANRNVAGGLENRVSIATNGTTLNLQFATGSRVASSVRTLIGFPGADKTGATSYTGSTTAGTALIPEYVGFNYLPPELFQEKFGSVNISASGIKEAIVFSEQRFWQAEFKYETFQNAVEKWAPFMAWATAQRLVEFTPEISKPNTVYEGTLEKTEQSGSGLGFKMPEMIPNMPGLHRTGLLTFRVRQ